MEKIYFDSLTQIPLLKLYAFELNKIKNDLKDLQNMMNTNWSSEEVEYINNFINNIEMEMIKASKIIDTIAEDINRAIESQKKEDKISNTIE